MTLHTHKGTPTPLGLSFEGEKANFSLFSSTASTMMLRIFGKDLSIQTIPMNRTGNVWHIALENLPPQTEYRYQSNLSKNWLLDPYAKIIGDKGAKVEMPPSFDWGGDIRPHLDKSDLIIYEMHVRGFTKDPTSKALHPGTFLGIVEKIPYLKELGINAVELMPIFNFEKKIVPDRTNYWGYNPIHFFTLMPGYGEIDPIKEFKTMVKELHKNGIEVILDVVYNHTAKSCDLRVLDKRTYYMINKDGHDLNFSGCGNTLNVNHPVTEKLILDSLCYWIEEMHVDGFRFDLASIFSRKADGSLIDPSPILQKIKEHPVISKVKLIAEAWDAAGLYQVGHFYKFGPWSEWNGRFRDTVRKFIKGDSHQSKNFASSLFGSAHLYKKTPISSINFITAHDGFCLKDLVSFQQKHNEKNGEKNKDGSNHNDSWNCGKEGVSDDEKVIFLRGKQMRNFFLSLFLSQGIPMLLMGDEAGHTREGNNNPYSQDNKLNWHLWDKIDSKVYHFVSKLISFRKTHKILKFPTFFKQNEVHWINSWEDENKWIGYVVKKMEPNLLIAFNASHEPLSFQLPEGPWELVVNTEEPWIFHENERPPFLEGNLSPYSSILLKKS